MTFTKRVKTVATSIAVGTAMSAAAVIGFAGPANAAVQDGATAAAVRDFTLCNGGTDHAVRVEGVRTSVFVPSRKCVTVSLPGGSNYQLHFKFNGGREKLSTVRKVCDRHNTTVKTQNGGGFSTTPC